MKAKTTLGNSALCFLLASMLAAPVAAGGPEETNAGPRERYWYLSLGGYEGPEFEALENDDAAGGLGVGFGVFFHKNLTFEFEASVFGADYKAPPHVARGLSSDTLTLDTYSLMTNLKASRRFGRVEPFVGVGVGLGLIELTTEESLYLAPPLEDEFTLLTRFMLGAGIRFKKRHHLGLSFRKTEFQKDFEWRGEKVDPSSGGVVLTYQLDL